VQTGAAEKLLILTFFVYMNTLNFSSISLGSEALVRNVVTALDEDAVRTLCAHAVYFIDEAGKYKKYFPGIRG